MGNSEIWVEFQQGRKNTNTFSNNTHYAPGCFPPFRCVLMFVDSANTSLFLLALSRSYDSYNDFGKTTLKNNFKSVTWVHWWLHRYKIQRCSAKICFLWDMLHLRMINTCKFSQWTQWGRYTMVVILLRIISNAFSRIKMSEIRLQFHWTVLLSI